MTTSIEILNDELSKANEKIAELESANLKLSNDLADRTEELQSVLKDYVAENEERSNIEKELMRLNDELKQSREAIVEDAQKVMILNDKLAFSEQNLKEANNAKDKFISIIAHDLINPLQILVLSAEYLLKNGTSMIKEDLDAEYRDIYNTSRNVADLLDNLLKWARSQSGRIKFQPEKLNICQLVENNFDLLLTNATKKGIRLVSEILDDEYVFGDNYMMSTVLRNLISNAIKFTPENGTVKVGIARDTENISIRVSDTGIGISPDDIEKLFRIDVHHTTIGTGKEKGTGLGLILCKEFVEKNKGRIWVESRLNMGSTFIFTIPLFGQQELWEK